LNSGKLVLVINFLTLILIILTGIFEINLFEKDTKIFVENLTKTKKAVESTNWQVAYENIKELNKNWESKKQMWAVFINHNEIDNITMYLRQSMEFIKHQDKTQAMASLAILEHYLIHISEIEKLKIENII